MTTAAHMTPRILGCFGMIFFVPFVPLPLFSDSILVLYLMVRRLARVKHSS